MKPSHHAPAFAAAALALSVGACGHNPLTASATLTDRECLARAMYFESNRSSEDGMTAVGTVVMNRLESGRYPGSVCGVVGQRNQFAPGVLSNPVHGRSWQLALSKADQVLAGDRHRRVGTAMHFHTAGYTYPYRNMAYVVAAGGNVFYDKKAPGTFTPVNPNILVAEVQRVRTRPSETITLASAEEALPIRRPEPSRLAARENSDERPAARPPFRAALAQRDLDLPRTRAKPDRIRLANLEEEAMPKAFRQRSDTPSFRLPAQAPIPDKKTPHPGAAANGKAVIPHAEAEAKGGLRSARDSRAPIEAPPRGATRDPGAGKALSYHSALADRTKIAARMDMPARNAPRAEPVKASATKPAPGQPLPYREAKAKSGAPDALARTGWKRGPDPAAKPLPEKAKKGH